MDDASTKEFLGQQLDDYVNKFDKVKIVRNQVRKLVLFDKPIVL